MNGSWWLVAAAPSVILSAVRGAQLHALSKHSVDGQAGRRMWLWRAPMLKAALSQGLLAQECNTMLYMDSAPILA